MEVLLLALVCLSVCLFVGIRMLGNAEVEGVATEVARKWALMALLSNCLIQGSFLSPSLVNCPLIDSVDGSSVRQLHMFIRTVNTSMNELERFVHVKAQFSFASQSWPSCFLSVHLTKKQKQIQCWRRCTNRLIPWNSGVEQMLGFQDPQVEGGEKCCSLVKS